MILCIIDQHDECTGRKNQQILIHINLHVYDLCMDCSYPLWKPYRIWATDLNTRHLDKIQPRGECTSPLHFEVSCEDITPAQANELFSSNLSEFLVSKPEFSSKVMTSYSGYWFMLLLLCTSAPLVLCCDQFDHGSSQVKCEPVDLVTEDYDVSLCQRIWERGKILRQIRFSWLKCSERG